MFRPTPSFILLAGLSLCVSNVYAASALAPAGVWDNFNYAPSSRTVWPAAIHGTSGTVSSSQSLVGASEGSMGSGTTTISGNGSYVTLDFGKEVGGLVSIRFGAVASNAVLSLSFTESPLYIRPYASDDSVLGVANTTYDGVLSISPVPSNTLWTMDPTRLRGGFRYLTLVSNSNVPVTLSNVSTAIMFSTNMPNLRAYTGYFYAKDPTPPSTSSGDSDFLTKLWYAGAYTVQTNIVPLNSGRNVPRPASPGWLNSGSLGISLPGTPQITIVDGAKRDRAVWPGDMYIALPTGFLSVNDLVPSKNAIATMFNYMNPTTGQLTESGPPLLQKGSDTYHMWTLIGVSNVFMWSGDTVWLNSIWSNYTKAVGYSQGLVDGSGLMNVTSLRDWARMGQGGHNAEANAIFYKLLLTASTIASALKLPNHASTYTSQAAALATAYNKAFWVPSVGLYKDNDTSTTIHPQDANSMAVLFGLADASGDSTRAGTISDNLRNNWGAVGPVPPELPDTVSPFISGYELGAHFAACKPSTAMDLMRLEWGYMLYTPLSVQSTLIEGMTANGSIAYRYADGYGNDPSYTSHAHGWSTAPTSILSYSVLGLTFTSPAGRAWKLSPFLSGLPSAQGGFQGALGWFGVNWTLNGKVMTITVQTPTGTSGVVNIPACNGAIASILVNGKSVTNGSVVGGGNATVVVTFM